MKVAGLLLLFFLFSGIISAQSSVAMVERDPVAQIEPGAHQLEAYLPLLKKKRVGIFANQTTRVGDKHLVDTLKKLGIAITVIFGPEHGFRGTADAGEKVSNYVDKETGIPVVSLYGAKRKPSGEDLKEVDILLFDIQDVGTRFYTYISSLEEFMQAAAEFKKPLIILDRPNPNGHYVDGPVLDKKFASFVGMQPVPVVYGMTIGEYAQMILSENWIGIDNYTIGIFGGKEQTKRVQIAEMVFDDPIDGKNQKVTDTLKTLQLSIVLCRNYNHLSKYVLPVRPSPNLPDIQSIYLYPSTCFFEGTVFSEGRGTSRPFQVFGHPSLPKTLYSFTPNPNEGARSSKLYGQVCYGWDLGGTQEDVLKKVDNKVQIKWLIDAYKLFPKKDSFYILPKSGKMEQSFFNKLAGNDQLWRQIKAGKTEEQIRNSWKPGIDAFKKIRKKYLLYTDFED